MITSINSINPLVELWTRSVSCKVEPEYILCVVCSVFLDDRVVISGS
jgi:hypothetical protein